MAKPKLNIQKQGFPSVADAYNDILGIKSDKTATAKEFIEKLEDKGVSKDSALKLYTALKSYTSMAAMLGKTSSFVSAKI